MLNILINDTKAIFGSNTIYNIDIFRMRTFPILLDHLLIYVDFYIYDSFLYIMIFLDIEWYYWFVGYKVCLKNWQYYVISNISWYFLLEYKDDKILSHSVFSSSLE